MTPALVPLHGIGSRQDLPLPFEYLLVGAAVALVVSFVVLAFAWRTPRWRTASGIALPGLTRLVDRRGVRAVLRLVPLLLYAWVGLALWFGQDRVTNPVFGFVFVWIWVGLVPVSLLFGGIWRATNPLRTLYRLVVALAPGLRRESGVIRRLGVRPAALALAAFAWLELVQPDNNTLLVFQIWTVAYLGWTLGGALAFGEGWIGAADPFEVFATHVSWLSPWQRIDGVLHLTNPLRHVTTVTPPVGSAAVVCVLLGSTAFDSFGNVTAWLQAVQGSPVSAEVWRTLGLFAMIGIVAVTYWLGCRLMRPFLSDAATGPADGRARLSPSRLLAPSVVPIVVGYTVGHYLSLLVLEGQRVLVNLSDPLGRGWDVFGTGRMAINTTIFDHPESTAIIQFVAIVGGHLLGVIAAHDLSLRVLRRSHAVAGQIPMLAVMVFYTCAGLLLLFSP